MSDRELMQNVSGSYDDFVNAMVRWMSSDSNIRNKVRSYLNVNPNPSTSDVLGILWECLGVGEPLEIVDDDNYNVVSSANMRVIV